MNSTDERLVETLTTAKGISFDGCHKIYIHLDESGMVRSHELGYGDGTDASRLIRIDPTTPGREQAAATVRRWYDESCGLKFVQIIHGTGDSNEDYEALVEQCHTWDGIEIDDEDEY